MRVLATELILYADKICVDEEIVRLQTHVAHMTETLTQAGDAVGRKLDFLTQEMNREAIHDLGQKPMTVSCQSMGLN